MFTGLKISLELCKKDIVDVATWFFLVALEKICYARNEVFVTNATDKF